MGRTRKQSGECYSPMRVGAVLLAAGQGSRMGNQPKAMLRLQSVPLINWHLLALSRAGVDEVVVVTGFYYQQIEPLIQSFPVRIVRNQNPIDGQPSSVRLGIETLGDRFDAVIMMLCDQPLVNANDIRSLISAFEKRTRGEIVVPMVHGERGNPIIFSGKVISEILAQDQNMYCRKYMDSHPELVTFFDTNNKHYVVDVDTLEDIASFEEKWGFKLQAPEMSSAENFSSDTVGE